MFKDGVSKIYAAAPEGAVGPIDGTFVFPSSYVDDIIEMSQGDVRILEELLGLDPGYLGDTPVRIDVPSPKGLRMPNGNELGVNDHWIPGGYTSGGIPEAVVDQIRMGEYRIDPAF